jgi:diguanylate cyclase (GGDEF)-like protein/PAS domain S-box-containing protein
MRRLKRTLAPSGLLPFFGLAAALLALPIALAYVGLAWLVTHYFFLISPIWPSAAVAAAGVMLYGRAALPGIFIGSYVANNYLMQWSPMGAVIASFGNALGPLMGAYLYRRLTTEDYFDSTKAVGLFLFTQGGVATLLSAVVGIIGVSFTGPGAGHIQSDAFLSWWVGDLTSVTMLAPAIYLWGQWLYAGERYPNEQQGRLELILTSVMILGGSFVIFGYPSHGSVMHIGTMALVLPPLVWAAQRYNPRIALTLFATLYVVAMSGTMLHRGPFGGFELGSALTALQLMGASISSAILIASVLDLQRRKITTHLREVNETLAARVAERTLALSMSESRMRHMLEMTPMPMLITELATSQILFVNEECLNLYGITRAEAKKIVPKDLWADPSDREQIISRLKAGESIRNHEAAFKGPAGEIIWFSMAVVLTQLDQKEALLFAFKDISLHKIREAALITQATTDELTGLHNRRQVLELYHRLIEQPRPTAEEITLCIFDLDHFKKINDTYGHLCGDEVLRAVAKLVQQSLREHDIFGRWGGEEFILILPGTPWRGANLLIERLRQKISELSILCDGGNFVSISASFGVVGGVLDHVSIRADLFDIWLSQADSALYCAKNKGRNRIEMHPTQSL